MGRDSRSCQDAADTLKRCLRDSQCVKGGRSMKDCVKEVDECKLYRNAYVLCKQDQFNMRSRIHGVKGT